MKLEQSIPQKYLNYEITFDSLFKFDNYIRHEQYGFMKQRSTVTQLISYLDKVYAAKDTTQDRLTVYLDVKKTFESVSHRLLFHKLSSFDFDNNLLMLFQSYFIGRMQVVKVDRSFPSEVVVTSGVPQDPAWSTSLNHFY